MPFGEGPIPGVTEFPWFTGKGNDLRVDVNLGRMAGLGRMACVSDLEGEDRPPSEYMRAEDILAQAVCDGADPRNFGFTAEQAAWGLTMKRMGLLDCTQPYPVWIKTPEAPMPPPPLNPWKVGWYRPNALSTAPRVSAGEDSPGYRAGDPAIEKRTTVRDPDNLDFIFGVKRAAPSAPTPWGTIAAVAGVGFLAYLLLKGGRR